MRTRSIVTVLALAAGAAASAQSCPEAEINITSADFRFDGFLAGAPSLTLSNLVGSFSLPQVALMAEQPLLVTFNAIFDANEDGVPEFAFPEPLTVPLTVENLSLGEQGGLSLFTGGIDLSALAGTIPQPDALVPASTEPPALFADFAFSTPTAASGVFGGNETLTLDLSGELVGLLAFFLGDLEPDGTVGGTASLFISASVIPAPGVLGLCALAGVAATRRRR